MKNHLKIDHGLVLNDSKIRFNNETTFKESTSTFLKVIEYNGYFTYTFWGMNFGFSQCFHQNKKYGSPFMVWLEGKCHTSGWDSTQEDLEKDFKKLVKNVESFTGINGIMVDEHSAKFYFKGVKIDVTSSLQTMNCYIEFGI